MSLGFNYEWELNIFGSNNLPSGWSNAGILSVNFYAICFKKWFSVFSPKINDDNIYMVLNQNIIWTPLNCGICLEKVNKGLNENGHHISLKIVYERINISKTRGTSYITRIFIRSLWKLSVLLCLIHMISRYWTRLVSPLGQTCFLFKSHSVFVLKC